MVLHTSPTTHHSRMKIIVQPLGREGFPLDALGTGWGFVGRWMAWR